MDKSLLGSLAVIVGEENVRPLEPLAPHTTFRIGGPVDAFVSPRSVEEVSQVVRACEQASVPWRVIGCGSDLLVSDEGVEGVVIEVRDNLSAIRVDGTRIVAGAGATNAAVAEAACAAGLSGYEFACGIPGTVGGAVYMNAGAYGGEMKDVLEAVSYLTADGRWVDSEASELDFSYRHSAFEENDACILGAVFHLEKGDPDAIKARMNELMQKRIDKQPLDKPSAGSTFKRPAGAFAAALIDQCGLRGYRHGGAAVSDKHCGFVVNLGGATCADVLALCDEVRAIVKEKTGYDLEKEIRVVK